MICAPAIRTWSEPASGPARRPRAVSAAARGVDGRLTSYGDAGFSSFLRRAFLASAGYDRSDLERPVVAVVDTSSDYTTCHRDMPALVEAVRRGVLQGGALPLTLPTLSLGEILITPTSMLYRNLLAMETEEALTACLARGLHLHTTLAVNPEGVPLGILRAGLPDGRGGAGGGLRQDGAGAVDGGRLRRRSGRGPGHRADADRLLARHAAGRLHRLPRPLAAVPRRRAESGRAGAGAAGAVPYRRHLHGDGKAASTMACLTEALGLMLPGGATAPSGSGARLRHAVATGRRAAALAQAPLRPRAVLTPAAFANAVTALLAIGGSTNAVIHLLAIARRAGVPLSLDAFEAAAARVPLLVDCKPSGSLWLEDLDQAGGMPAVLAELCPLLQLEARCVSGLTLGEQLAAAAARAQPGDPAGGSARGRRGANTPAGPVIGTLEAPIGGLGALAVLRGSLAPDGAILKRSAATPALLQHRGPALVFDSPADLAARIDDPALPVTPGHVLVLRNSGPAAAGMPETGSLPIPRKLAVAGVRDMVRVSDARMSGTAGGTVVLHCSPEAARGGPLALVEDGDLIELDAGRGRIDLLVAPTELAARRGRLRAQPALPARGWRRLHAEHVLPAHLGADLDFLAPGPSAGPD